MPKAGMMIDIIGMNFRSGLRMTGGVGIFQITPDGLILLP
jgi:hypothetical protein